MNECQGCGREIIWGKNFNNGKTIPLDKCKNAYREMGGEFAPVGQFQALMVEQIKDETIYVSHFLTCPDANKFSGKNKEVTEQK